MKFVYPIKSKEDLQNMVNHLKESDKRNFLLFITGIVTTLRCGDILKLKVGDVLTHEGKIKDSLTVKTSKTDKTQTHIITKTFKSALSTYFKEYPIRKNNLELYLFPSRKGGGNKPITVWQANNILKNAALDVGIKDPIGSHSMRKTGGYQAWQQGQRLESIQVKYGHSHPNITLRYLALKQQEMDDVALALDGVVEV